MRKKPWTQQELELLREKYPITGSRELSLLIGHTWRAIKEKAKVLGLRKANYYWTDDEIVKLRSLYPDTSNDQLPVLMGREYHAVVQKAHALGLRKSEAFVLAHRDRFIEGGKKTRLGPGHPSFRWNSGKKGIRFPGSEKGWFRKGAVNGFAKQQLKHDGAITVRYCKTGHRGGERRPMKFIRIAQGKWKQLQVHVWEQQYGAVPKGMRLCFRDGDSMNCDIGNLELRTPSQCFEQMILCDSYIAAQMARVGRHVNRKLKAELLNNPDLIELKRNSLLLQRSIHEKEQQLR